MVGGKRQRKVQEVFRAWEETAQICAKRANRFEKDWDWSEPQWIHRFWLLFPLTRAPPQVTILPLSSVLFSPHAIS